MEIGTDTRTLAIREGGGVFFIEMSGDMAILVLL
jgi:hypothetical protein